MNSKQLVMATGRNVSDLLDFIDDRKDDDTYERAGEIIAIGKFNEGTGKTASVELLAVLVTAASGVFVPLIVEYFKSRHQNELTFKRTRDDGTEVSVTVKGVSKDQVKQQLEDFFSNN